MMTHEVWTSVRAAARDECCRLLRIGAAQQKRRPDGSSYIVRSPITPAERQRVMDVVDDAVARTWASWRDRQPDTDHPAGWLRKTARHHVRHLVAGPTQSFGAVSRAASFRDDAMTRRERQGCADLDSIPSSPPDRPSPHGMEVALRGISPRGKAVAAALAAGLSCAQIGAAVGRHRMTVHRWRERLRAELDPQPDWMSLWIARCWHAVAACMDHPPDPPAE